MPSAAPSISMMSICPRLALARRAAEMHAPRSRSRVRRTSIFPYEDLLDRRSCFAVAQIPRGQQQARRAAGPGGAHLHAADRRTLHRPGLLMPSRMFSKSAALLGAARKSASTTTEAVPAPRRSQPRSVVEHRRGCSGMRAGRRKRQNPQPTGGNNAACIGRGRSSVSRQQWHGVSRAGSAHNSRSDGARLWNRLYTLWGADRAASCGRNAVVR
jgi:hypothetical protein